MRKLLYTFALLAIGVMSSNCLLGGLEGSSDGTTYTKHNGWDDASGAATIVGLTNGTETWWPLDEMKNSNSGGCTSYVAGTYYNSKPGPDTPARMAREFSGDFTLNANFHGAPGQLRTGHSVRDDSGDGYVSGLGAPLGISSLAFFPVGSCGTSGFFADTVRESNAGIPFGAPAWKSMVTDNFSFNWNRTGNMQGNQGAASRITLEQKIAILSSIDAERDIVMIDGVENLRLRVTSVTVDEHTFQPEGLEFFVTFGGHVHSGVIDITDPNAKPMYAWMADRLQLALDAGREADWSITVNDSFTFSSMDWLGFLDRNDGVTATSITSQMNIDRLRDRAGSDVTGTDPTSRGGLR